MVVRRGRGRAVGVGVGVNCEGTRGLYIDVLVSRWGLSVRT